MALGVVALAIGVALAMRAARTQRQSREEARDTRVRLLTLNELLDAGVWQTDVDHRLLALQPPKTQPAGLWPAGPATGLLWERFAPADPTALRARLDRGEALDDVEVRFDAGPAGPLSLLLRGRVITDATGRFAGYLGTVRGTEAPTVRTMPTIDATVAALAGPARNPASASSAYSASSAIARPRALPTEPLDGSLVAEHESFSFTVSHDLRAPIRVVEGFTKIVKEDYGRLLDRVGNEHLDRVLGAAARMNNMIDALLALSKLSSQPLATQPVNLSQLAAFVVDDLKREWPEREISVEIADGMQVQGDPTLLRVVIENLIGNAWKYTGKAAAPRIAFGPHEKTASAFTVSDNGAGFDMRFADRLFGVFQRLHSANDFPGTGVGLASVRRIVRRHGGEIWGEGEVMRGARFHFTLPTSAGAAPSANG